MKISQCDRACTLIMSCGFWIEFTAAYETSHDIVLCGGNNPVGFRILGFVLSEVDRHYGSGCKIVKICIPRRKACICQL